MGSRAVISKFSKAAVFDVFVARRCGFRYYWMQEVVPRCAIFAKLQNSLIQPRTSQKKLSLFENVSYFVFIVWRSTDRQFFYSPIRRAWAISTGFFLDFCTKVKEESGARGADLWLFENARNHAKSRTTAENIAYRTNQRPLRA